MNNKKFSKGQTQVLEKETQQMEDRIIGLKQMLQTMRTSDRSTGTGSRWKQASTNKPLNNFAKQSLQKRIFPIQKSQQRSLSKSKVSVAKSSTSLESNKSRTNSFILSDISRDQNIAGNLQRALLVQKQQQNEVVQFLGKLKLQAHAGVLLENGFDDMEVLKDIEILHLQDMKIPPKDARTILNALKPVEEIKPVPIAQQSKQEPIKDSLGTGEFDEEASHRYFMEALLEFRADKHEVQVIEQKPVQHDYYGPISSRQKKKQLKKVEFFLQQNDKAWHMFDIESDNIQQTDQIPIIVDKKYCYMCYKLCINVYEVGQNHFCTPKCVQNYKQSQIYRCRSTICQKQIDQDISHYAYGRWFCDEKCAKQFVYENQQRVEYDL